MHPGAALALGALLLATVGHAEKPLFKQRAQLRRSVKQAAQRAVLRNPPASAGPPCRGGDAPSPHTAFKRSLRNATGAPRCIYVDIGANHADTFDAFTIGNDDRSRNARKGAKVFHWSDEEAFPVGGQLRGKRHLSQPSPCPHQDKRAQVDVYAVEANPIHDGVLIDRFCRFPNFMGLYNRTAVWNVTGSAVIKFYLDLVDGDENTWPFAWGATTNPESAAELCKKGAKKGRPVSDCMKHIVVPTLDVCELLLREVSATPADRVVVKVDIEDADEVLLERILAVPDCLAAVDVIAYEDAARKASKRSAYSNALEARFRAKGISVRGWY